MEKNDLQTLQQEELKLLLELRKICRKLDLRYYLTAGTLLGAVRHKGFIPWDDDIDVAMPRKDYDRLAQLAPQYISGEYVYQEYRTEPNFPYYFAKLHKQGTYVEEPILRAIPMEQGIYIDIFPLDRCPNSDRLSMLFFKGIELLDCAVLARVSPEFQCRYEKKYMRLLWNVLQRLPNGALFALREGLRKLFGLGGKKLCTVGGRHGYPRESYRAEWFQETVYLDFENEQLPAPVGWEELLKNMYGDYMRLPPPEEREQHFIQEHRNGGER